MNPVTRKPHQGRNQPQAVGQSNLAHDAKRVEDAFAARMALQSALPEALTTDEPPSAPTDPTPPQPSSAPTDAVKPLRPKGRPRKVKAAAEPSAAPPVLPKPTIDDSP